MKTAVVGVGYRTAHVERSRAVSSPRAPYLGIFLPASSSQRKKETPHTFDCRHTSQVTVKATTTPTGTCTVTVRPTLRSHYQVTCALTRQFLHTSQVHKATADKRTSRENHSISRLDDSATRAACHQSESFRSSRRRPASRRSRRLRSRRSFPVCKRPWSPPSWPWHAPTAPPAPWPHSPSCPST
jgi:hypothetical protein